VIITSTGMHEPILDRHLFEPVLNGVRKHLALLGTSTLRCYSASRPE
jgi:hypothetical protein